MGFGEMKLPELSWTEEDQELMDRFDWFEEDLTREELKTLIFRLCVFADNRRQREEYWQWNAEQQHRRRIEEKKKP